MKSIKKIWVVEDGVWKNLVPTQSWYKRFLTDMFMRNIVELAKGTSIAKRSKFSTSDPSVNLIIEWS